jgi:ATP-dependent exoDNAse (exonuclease V) beta subunit
VIDRCFVADGYRWIVDYKTARLPDDELPQRAESYRPQLERYVRLFAGDAFPVKAAIYFPLQGKLIELPLG